MIPGKKKYIVLIVAACLIIVVVLATVQSNKLPSPAIYNPPALIAASRVSKPIEVPDEERTIIKWETFGIKSTNTPKQNDIALYAFNRSAQGKGKPKYFIDAKNLGLIQFTWNEYLSGVINFICDWTGTQIQCVNSSIGWGEQQPIMNETFYFGGTGQPFAGKKIIRTANKGDTKFYIPSTDKSLYTPGRTFFVGADERQFYGWPPNFTVSEWHQVKAIGTDTIGTYVQLVEPIAKLWSFNYFDIIAYEVNGFNAGKPRVWFTDNYGEYAEFINGELLANPVSGKGSFLFRAKTLITSNLKLGPGVNCNASENKVAIYKNLFATAEHEIDKSVGYVEYNGGTSGWMQTAGAERVVLRNHKMTRGNNLSADYVDIQNCELDMQKRNHPALYPHPEGRYTKEYVLKNYKIRNVTTEDGLFNMSFRSEFTIDGVTNKTNGSDIFFPTGNAREGLAKTIYPECLLWSYNQKTNVLKVAKVSHIEATNEHFIIKNSGAKWALGDKVYHTRVGYVKDLGGNSSDKWGSPFFAGTDLKWKGNTGTNIGRRTTIYNAKDFKWISTGGEKRMLLDGTIHSITINILRPLKGWIIWYKNDYGDWDKSRIFQVDMSKTGKRIITKTSVTGKQAGEYFNVANLNTFIHDIPYTLGATAGTNLDNLFTIAIDWTPYK